MTIRGLTILYRPMAGAVGNRRITVSLKIVYMACRGNYFRCVRSSARHAREVSTDKHWSSRFGQGVEDNTIVWVDLGPQKKNKSKW